MVNFMFLPQSKITIFKKEKKSPGLVALTFLHSETPTGLCLDGFSSWPHPHPFYYCERGQGRGQVAIRVHSPHLHTGACHPCISFRFSWEGKASSSPDPPSLASLSLAPPGGKS